MYSAPKTGAPAWEVSPSASMGRRQNQGLKMSQYVRAKNSVSPEISYRYLWLLNKKCIFEKYFWESALVHGVTADRSRGREGRDPMGSDAFKTPPLLLPPPPSESQKREELAIPPPPFAIYWEGCVHERRRMQKEMHFHFRDSDSDRSFNSPHP